MLNRLSPLVAVAAAGLVLACDRTPTSPEPSGIAAVQDEALSKRKGAELTGAIDQTIDGNRIIATIRITRFGQDAEGALLASGVISGTANGMQFEQEFSNHPVTLSRGTEVASADATAATRQVGDLVLVGSQTMAVRCDIINLDLGPLNLNILGLVIDLEPVVLDIFAETGAGNLLGNLLCAIVGLLDGPGILASVGQILDQINAILGAL